MTTLIQTPLSRELNDFIELNREKAEFAFEVFRETRTITANGTVNFVERGPENTLVTFNYAGPWSKDKKAKYWWRQLMVKFYWEEKVQVAAITSFLKSMQMSPQYLMYTRRI